MQPARWGREGVELRKRGRQEKGGSLCEERESEKEIRIELGRE